MLNAQEGRFHAQFLEHCGILAIPYVYQVMLKNIITKYPVLFWFLIPAVILLGSCHNDEPEPPRVRSTSILLYAVASNNLSYAFTTDMEEIREAGESIDLSEVDFYVYSVQSGDNAHLKRMVKDSEGNVDFETVKVYDRSMYSTDPRRMSDVISTYIGLTHAANRGLILWSHATGWKPEFSDHIVPEMSYSYGADQYKGKTDYCDILELDTAIPAGIFDYIWFDCCYMSSIECLYQLRDKANYFVGSPMEVAGEGCPYHLVLPLLARSRYSLPDAVEMESRYYSNRGMVYALALVDASALNEVAVAAEKGVTGKRPSPLRLQSYHRPPVDRLYDFQQYTHLWGSSLGDAWDELAFSTAMEKLVLYKSCSDTDWRKRPIDRDNFSGISVYYFQDLQNEETEHYKKLDWFRDVYTEIPPF